MGPELVLILRLLISLTTAAQHGIPAMAKLAEIINAARAENRDVSIAELEALANETDAAIAEARDALEAAANAGDGVEAPT